MRNSMGIHARFGRAAVLATLGVACLALVAPGQAKAADPAPACKVSTRPQTITRMGRSPFVKKGVKTREDLAALFVKDKDAIACVLETHGLERLEDALAQAAGGSAVTERDLRDECFEWMAWRSRKGVTVSGPLCLKSKKTYGTFEVPVDEMIAETLPEVRCEIQASGDAAAKPPVLSASIDGSTPGATASWTSTNGTSGDLAGSGPWQMEWKDLCTADYTFTVKDTDQGTQTWVTHSFLVPKICGNISYAGVSAPRTVPGKSDECTSSVEVKRFVPPPPKVSLSVTPTKVGTRETVVAQSSADSVCLKSCEVTVTSNCGGETDHEPCGPSWEKVFTVPGIYTYRATAEDAIGQTGEAGPISVRVHPRWTVRGFGSFIDPKDDVIRTDRNRTPTQAERTAWSLEKGWGIGASVERRFTEIVGLEGAVIVSRVDSSFKLDLGTAWAIAKKDVDLNLLMVGPNFHVLHEPCKADLYIGPFLGYALFSAKSYGVLGESHSRDLDDKLGFGVQIGLDLPIHRAAKGIWNFHTDLRYLDLSTDVDLGPLGSKSVSVDPLILSAGISYSF